MTDASVLIGKYVALFKSIERNDNLQKKWMGDVLKDWQKNEVIEIAKTGGNNIGQPFKDKKTTEWQKYRKYKVPVNWCLGVWTGATLYSLMKGKGVGGINIIKRIEPRRIEYGYQGNKYINFNVGVSKSFIDRHTEIIKDKVENYIKEGINKI